MRHLQWSSAGSKPASGRQRGASTPDPNPKLLTRTVTLTLARTLDRPFILLGTSAWGTKRQLNVVLNAKAAAMHASSGRVEDAVAAVEAAGTARRGGDCRAIQRMRKKTGNAGRDLDCGARRGMQGETETAGRAPTYSGSFYQERAVRPLARGKPVSDGAVGAGASARGRATADWGRDGSGAGAAGGGRTSTPLHGRCAAVGAGRRRES